MQDLKEIRAWASQQVTNDMVELWHKGLSPTQIAKEMKTSCPVVITRLKSAKVYRPHINHGGDRRSEQFSQLNK